MLLYMKCYFIGDKNSTISSLEHNSQPKLEICGVSVLEIPYEHVSSTASIIERG